MSRSVLDSSPLRAEFTNRDILENAQTRPPPRPLKRSASTASLLTPPQTIEHKGRYARSRGSGRGSDGDEDEDDEVSDYASTTRRRLNFGRKKQRTDRLDAVLATLSGEDAENPFWDRRAATADKGETSRKVERRSETATRSSSPPVERHFRGKAPVSPPPSLRQTGVRQRSRSDVTPSTPKGKGRTRVGRSDTEAMEDEPIRDSPNNPFLDDSPMSITGEPAEPRTPTEHGEKPTLQYVFRGVKATFANPLYSLPPEVRERSLLPVEHPDYSPNPACPPKLLFAEARRKRQPASPTRAAAKASHRTSARNPPSRTTQAGNEWNDSEEDELHITPPKRLLFRES